MEVAYVGPYLSVGSDDPGLQRALGISRALTSFGARVQIAGGDHSPAKDDVLAPGMTATSLGEVSPSDLGRLRKGAQRAAWGRRTVEWLRARSPRPDVVIIYGGGALFAGRVLRWARAHGVATIVDCVEWHDGGHQPLGRWGPVAMDFEIAMTRVYQRAGNVICISSLLQEHFTRQGCSALLVPPTTDVQQLSWCVEPTNVGPSLRFAYAGTPGKKDLIKVVIEGLRLADPSGRVCRLDIAGMTTDDVADLSLGGDGIPQSIHAHGRLPRSRALELVSGAHYTCLLRHDARYAHAGFPTKVVESLAVGTPVMTNRTSDLGAYIRDGETGFIIEEASADSFADSVRDALSVSPATYLAMRRAARAEAEAHFDFRGYAPALRDFIERSLKSAPTGRRR